MSIFHNPNAASPGGGPYHKEVPSILNSVKDVWTNVLGHMKNDLSETTINTWFDELEAVDIQGNTLRLYCTNDFKKGYVESLFMKNIKAALKDIFSMDFEVVILDAPAYEELQGAGQKQQRDRFTSDEFTFETFVVGPSNKLAYSASMSVAEHPAQNYNPLLIYGNFTRKKRPTSKIVYIKGDEFINEFIELLKIDIAKEPKPFKASDFLGNLKSYVAPKYLQFLNDCDGDLLILLDNLFYAGRSVREEIVRLSQSMVGKQREFVKLCNILLSQDGLKFGIAPNDSQINIFGKTSSSLLENISTAISILTLSE